MTADQIAAAAEAAIRAMSKDARAAFVAMHEAGRHEETQQIAQAYAIEGVGRQIRLASLALESSRVMDGLVDLVGKRIGA